MKETDRGRNGMRESEGNGLHIARIGFVVGITLAACVAHGAMAAWPRAILLFGLACIDSVFRWKILP